MAEGGAKFENKPGTNKIKSVSLCLRYTHVHGEHEIPKFNFVATPPPLLLWLYAFLLLDLFLRSSSKLRSSYLFGYFLLMFFFFLFRAIFISEISLYSGEEGLMF